MSVRESGKHEFSMVTKKILLKRSLEKLLCVWKQLNVIAVQIEVQYIDRKSMNSFTFNRF